MSSKYAAGQTKNKQTETKQKTTVIFLNMGGSQTGVFFFSLVYVHPGYFPSKTYSTKELH